MKSVRLGKLNLVVLKKLISPGPCSILHRFRNTQFLSVKLLIFSYPSVLTCVLAAQKNRLSETVLLSTGNICFG